MSTSPTIDPNKGQPMVGFGGGMGGVHDTQGIFKGAETRFGSDFILSTLARGSAGVLLLMLVALVLVLTHAAIPSMHHFGARFLASSTWAPEHETQKRDTNGDLVKDEDGETVMTTVPGEFGALPVIYGTVVSSAIALILAVPLSLGASLFLVRIGPWLTPTFVRYGLLGILLTGLLMLFGAEVLGAVGGSIGVILGVASTCGLMWLAWQTDDPRRGLNYALEVPVGLGLLLVLTLLARFGGLNFTRACLLGLIASSACVFLASSAIAIISFLIEFLAAIPSIAYGIWGLFVVAPFLQHVLEPPFNRLFGFVPFLRFLHTDGGLTGRDMFAAGSILAIMIVPIITAISRDVLRSVPRIQIEGTQALGATWWQSSWAMLRYGRSGLFGAVMLGLARAAGETMAVAMVIGNAIQINTSIFKPAQTMASLLANEFAEASTDMHRSALVEVALILLVMSLLFNVVARYLVVGGQAKASG